jgi:hypothetical protein
MARAEVGRAVSRRVFAERRAARFEDFDFLTQQGVNPAEAATRAGWPSLQAAEIALRRAHHPAWHELAREVTRIRSHAA